jgi:hypothetical protein
VLLAKPTRLVMTMQMPGSAATVRQEYWRSGPRFYTRMETPGAGVTEVGSDGTAALMVSPQLGPMILAKASIDSLMVPDPAALLERKAMTYLGVHEIAGKKYDAVLFLEPARATSTAYFDPVSGLMAGMDFEKTPGPPGQMAMSFDEWKRFGEVLYPTRTAMRMADGKSMVTSIESFSTNPIDPRVFELPVKVRDLRTRSP